MASVGLVGPASPWVGGIASFTATLAGELASTRRVRWFSWQVPRILPPTTRVDAAADPTPAARAALAPYGVRSWAAVGRELHDCGTLLLTLTSPALLAPYARLARAYRECGGHVVLLCHNVVAHELVPGYRTLARRVLRLADALVVHAGSEATLAAELAPGVPVLEAFHPVYAEHVDPPPLPGARRLLAFGHVRRYKGLPDLLDALVLLPDASLDVVGVFEEPIARYRRQVERLGLADRVRLVDAYVPDTDLRAVFARADAVVAPYRQASQSGVVHLAYSLGRPVVATAVGGLPDAVAEAVTGALAAPRDPASLAAAIERVLARPPGFFTPGIAAVLAERTWSRYAGIVLAAAESRPTRGDRP
jgi:glycosyltransferase involved in cell wall biosynthesis